MIQIHKHTHASCTLHVVYYFCKKPKLFRSFKYKFQSTMHSWDTPCLIPSLHNVWYIRHVHQPFIITNKTQTVNTRDKYNVLCNSREWGCGGVLVSLPTTWTVHLQMARFAYKTHPSQHTTGHLESSRSRQLTALSQKIKQQLHKTHPNTNQNALVKTAKKHTPNLNQLSTTRTALVCLSLWTTVDCTVMRNFVLILANKTIHNEWMVYFVLQQ